MATSHKIRVGKAADVSLNDTKKVMVRDRQILLVNMDSEIYALDDTCVHGGCSLFHGKYVNGIIHCPCHGSDFDVKTGSVVNGPATSPQPIYEVTIENGDITLTL